MNRHLTGIAAFACLLLGASSVHAAEIHFRSESRVDGGLVLLGDVAEIFDADLAEVKRLSEIDLMPAPPRREKRIVRLRELQDLLHLRGVNPNDHRFTGASQVTVLGIGEATAAPVAKQPGYLNVPLQQVLSNVRIAVQDYITQQAGGDVEWQVKFDLKPEQAQTLAGAGTSLQVSGGESPWTGLQNLILSFPSHTGVTEVPVAVQVLQPPSVVVAVRGVARGSILRADDVRLQAGKSADGSVYVYTAIEEVVGKEATRALVEGQILDEQVIRRPILVERSDVVTVYARSAGLRVRTTARALESGGEGDLVRVEAMTDRKSYFARVSGPQEVEVFAHAPNASSAASASAGNSRVQQARFQKRLPPAPLPPGADSDATK